MLPPLSARTGLLCCGVLACFATILTGQTFSPAAAESNLGGAIAGDQDFPAVALSPTGGYLVWEDNRIDGATGHGIGALSLDGNLAAKGNIFRVNQQGAGNQQRPQAVLLNNGNALFLWESRPGTRPGIYARLLDTNGVFISGDLLVNRPTWTDALKQSTNWFGFYRNRWRPRRFKFRERIQNLREQAGNIAVGALPDGGAVVAFQEGRRVETNTWGLVRQVRSTARGSWTNDLLRPLRSSGDWMLDVFFQRLDSAGRKVGSEVLVNQSVDFNQRSPTVAVLPNGNFLVVWIAETPRSAAWWDNFRVDVFGRLFTAQGDPVGDEFPIAAGDDLVHANPAVAALGSGGFTVVWSQQEADGSRHWDVYGRAFGADAAASGPAFRVNAYTAGDQFGPRIAGVGENQVVVWTSVGQDGSREGVYGRPLASGALSGDEFRVNTSTVSRQIHPGVAADGQGRFLSVWSSYVGETGLDLFGQLFSVRLGQAAALHP